MSQPIKQLCFLCGYQTTVVHDGMGHLYCEDATACLTRVAEQEQAEYDALAADVTRLDAQRKQKLTRMGQLEQSLGKYDAVVAANKTELARIETE